MIYGFAGSTQFDALADVLGKGEPALGLIVGMVFLIAGLAFKISAVPFHMWTPDVYEGAPTPVTALFAVAPKVAAVCLILRTMMGPFGGITDQWQQVITLIAIASMVLGAVAAIQQTNLKRLMAYSSIGHMGYALSAWPPATPPAPRCADLHGDLSVHEHRHLRGHPVDAQGRALCENISDLAGLNKSHPMMALAMLIFMFSMAGIPPLAGFSASGTCSWRRLTPASMAWR